MSDELNLVKDLAVILIAAGFFTIVFKALKQPLILGYIIAGFFVGPHLGLFSLTSQEAVDQWSEIGIIFLLFALGLEFSFKKLVKVGSAAITMAVVKCAGMFVLGLIVGQFLGWTTMESIFLGGLLSMSSTTIIIKAYDEMGLKKKPYASVIFGSLVVEDLIAVLLMVLLSTMAATGRFEGGAMVKSLVRLVFFLVLWFLVGIYLIPSALRQAKKLLNDETLLIVAVGLCFGMVSIADSVGFSSALGAFVMGSILAETLEGERIERILGSIKDLFGAIFFVSVGMMVDPSVIGANWGAVLVLTLVVMIGHLLFSFGGAILAGKGLETATNAGFTLSQLGEFGFIIASLGCSLGVMRGFIYPVVIAVTVITTFTTPYMIKAAGPTLSFLRRTLPLRWQERIDSMQEDKAHTGVELSEWRVYLKNYFVRVGVYLVLLVAVSVLCGLFSNQILERWLTSWDPTARNILAVIMTILMLAPFIYGLTGTGPAMHESQAKLVKNRKSNAWPLLSLDLLRIGIAFMAVLLSITAHFDLTMLEIGFILLIFAVAYYPLRKVLNRFIHIEKRFMENLNATDERAAQRAPVTFSVKEKLEKYNVGTELVVISPNSQYVGLTLREMPFRHTSGVNIIKIQRGSKSIVVPSGGERIFPFDRLLAVGTREQLDSFLSIMQDEVTSQSPADFLAAAGDNSEFIVQPVTLEDDNSLIVGKTLRDLDMRSYGCMIICVLRGNDLITNPKAEFRFASGDLLWFAGAKNSLKAFLDE